MEDVYVCIAYKYGTNLNWFPTGGGNISVKCNNYMLIKESGTAVSDAKYVKCDIHHIMSNLTCQNDYIDDIITKSRASMEVWFHAFTKKYTIHMHPVELMEFLCTDMFEYDNKREDMEYLYIDYINPGKELAIEIHKQYDKHSVIFLKNHGVIFTSDSLEHLHEMIEKVLDLDKDWYILSDLLKDKLIWKSKYILHVGKLNVYIPDIVVYLGYEIVDVAQGIDNIEKYENEYNTYPVLISHKEQLYIIASSKRKYYDIEEMILYYIEVSSNAKITINYENVFSIMHMESEKYRQSVL